MSIKRLFAIYLVASSLLLLFGLVFSGCNPPDKNPCSSKNNPCCYPDECKLGKGVVGRCLPDPAADACTCQEIQADYGVCGEPNNATCEPDDCTTDTGEAGRCAYDNQACCVCNNDFASDGDCDGDDDMPGDGDDDTSSDGDNDLDPPADPCSLNVNPCCYPDECDMLDGTAGRCLPDPAADICHCQPLQQDYGMCGPPDNAACEAKDCKTDTGAPGQCAWDSMDCCICEGDGMADGDEDMEPEMEEEQPLLDPCSPNENPCCYPELCDLATGGQGRCLPDPAADVCSCQKIQQSYSPCGAPDNPACQPTDCTDDMGNAGLCQMDAVQCCSCITSDPVDGDVDTEPETPADPCADDANPCCYPELCELAPGAAPGRCLPDPAAAICRCQPLQDDYGTCGPPDNPACQPMDCTDNVGNAGLCKLDNDQCCSCEPTDPTIDGDSDMETEMEQEASADPCSPQENRCCYPYQCELAPGAEPGRCLPDADLGECRCQPIQPSYSTCGPPDNSVCDAMNCETDNGIAGLCKLDTEQCCRCNPLQ